ncbi:MAG: methionyl-tRNA formyltransferase [Acidimicrobiales bacterium]
MRLAFLGTPQAAVPSLESIVAAGHEVALVITRPDRRRARGGELVASPVKRAAQGLGLRVAYQLSDLTDVSLDRAVVVAYGSLIPPRVLDELAMLNVHFSLLPRWRGAAPVHRAILAGDEETGVSIISLEPSLDTGPVHLERRIPIAQKNVVELTNELATLGAGMIVEVLASLELLEHPYPQRGEVTYAEKITKETLRLLPTMTRDVFARVVRLGGSYFEVRSRRIVVESVRETCEVVPPGTVMRVNGVVVLGVVDGAVELDELRPEGSRTMSAQAWWAGLRGVDGNIEWF